MTIHLNSHWGGVLTKLLRDFLETEVDEEFYKKDARTQALIDKLIADVVEKYGRIDGLVNSGYPRTKDWGAFFEDIPSALAEKLDFARGGNRQP